MSYIDNVPVIIGHKKGVDKNNSSSNSTPTMKHTASKNSQTNNEVDMRKIEAGTIIPPKINLELAQAIMRARNNKKMTQKELARRVQLPESKIKDYENQNSNVTVESSVLQKISNVLGVKFEKPAPTYVTPDEDEVGTI